MIKILIADDHKIFRDGIESILEDLENMEVIGQAEDGRAVLEKLTSIQPDVILMDISMGGANGIETTELVKKAYPQIYILAISMHDETDYIIKMLDAGASGYLLKDAGSDEMIKAINTVAKGGKYYGRQVSAALIEHMTAAGKKKEKRTGIPLTRRETEILQLITNEFTNPEIAEKLFISIRTVDTHRRNLIEKLGVKNTAGLVKYALKNGLGDD